MRLLARIGAIAAMTLIVASPAHAKKAVLTFALWGTQDYLKAEQEAARLFSKTDPTVEVKPLLIAGNYRESIVTAIAGGKAPDIMIVSVEDFGYLSKHGFLMDLGPWYSAEKSYDMKDVYDILWRAFTVNGRKYGLPLNCGPVVEYFNPALFSRAGLPIPSQYEAQNAWNWDTFRECAQRMTVDANGDGKPEQFGFSNSDNGIMWGAYIKANGGDILDDTVSPTKVLLDSKEAAQALTFLQELLYKYRAAPMPRDNFPFATDAFVKGRLGMYEWWPSRLAVHAGSKMTDYDIAFLPKAPGGGRSTDFGTSALVIAKNSKNKDAAWRYAAYRCFSVPFGKASPMLPRL